MNISTSNTLLGFALPAIPWEEQPAGSHDVIWRYSQNPIVARNAIPTSNSIFNSAVVPFDGTFAGVFRCDNKKREMNLHAGRSQDAIHWDIDPNPIQFICDNPEVSRFQYRYDPRVCWIGIDIM